MKLDLFIRDAEKRGFEVDSSEFENDGSLIVSREGIIISRYREEGESEFEINVQFDGQRVSSMELFDFIKKLQTVNLLAFVMENIEV